MEHFLFQSFAIVYKFWLSHEPLLMISNTYQTEEKGRFEVQYWKEMEIFRVCCLFHAWTEVFKF